MEVLVKYCTNCKIEKSLDCFSKNKKSKDGYYTWCKECCKQHYEENKEEILIKGKIYNQKNKDEILKYQKQYYLEHIEKAKEYNNEYGKNYRKEHKEELAQFQSPP